MQKIIAHSLYTIKDQYFEDFPSPYWSWNKGQRRPYYHLMKDKDDILWVIPLSSQVQNYSKKIELYERKYGPGKCVYYHTGVLVSKTEVFKIREMFPIDESYINAPFTINGTHYVVKNKNLCSALHSKAMKYLKLVETGAIKSKIPIFDIKKKPSETKIRNGIYWLISAAPGTAVPGAVLSIIFCQRCGRFSKSVPFISIRRLPGRLSDTGQ